MCNFFSGIYDRQRGVLWSPGVDSHEDLLRINEIPDTAADPDRRNFVRFEITPPGRDVFEKDLTKWALKVDEQSVPAWWAESCEESCWNALRRCLEECVLDGGEYGELTDRRGLWLRNAKVEALLGSSQVRMMWESSQVRVMRGSSQVREMWGSSQVRVMRESSQVGVMRESSQVGEMRESSQVCEMRGSSQVGVMWESSQVGVMRDSSQVGVMWGSSQVGEMRDSSQVRVMRGSSQVGEMWESSQVRVMRESSQRRTFSSAKGWTIYHSGEQIPALAAHENKEKGK